MTEKKEKRDGAAEFAAGFGDYQAPPPTPTHNFFVYGPTGSGKTTLVKTLKSDVIEQGDESRALLLTTDKGSASIQSALHDNDPHLWLIERDIDRYQDLQDAYLYLATKDHPFSWVILDDATLMAYLLVDRLEDEFGDDTWGIYGALNKRFRRMLRSFRDLDTNVLFIAREGHVEGDASKKTAAFPGKALGEGNDKSSVLHEFDHAYRAHVDGPSDDPESYCLQTVGDESCEAKKRDEFHVLDEVIRDPDLSEVRTKLIDSITQNA